MEKSFADRTTTFVRMAPVPMPFRRAEAWLMAMLVPMIHTNQGKTRSATVRPFHHEWLKNQYPPPP